MISDPRRPNAWLMAIVAVLIVFSASAIGGYATYPSIPGWYAGLNKPAFTPPNWMFGPAWTTLNILTAIAFWRVLTRAAGTPGKGAAIAWFVGHIVLNARWSVAFFGLRSPLYGLVVIVLLIMAIVGTLRAFRSVDPLAA